MKYYLIAGEPSGDALGAKLMEALRRKDKKARFFGVGGDNMQAEGLNSLFDIKDLAVMGLAEVIPSIPKVLRRIRETVADIIKQQPDVVVTIDSWSFCVRIHKKLRKLKLGIPQVHYVAPQVWAWKKKRAYTMHKYIDHLLTLFPQEPKYFTPHNLEATFVGHPVIESDIVSQKESDFKKRHHVSANKKIILILPGSRKNEVERLLPDFLDAAKILQSKHDDLQFVVPTVSTVAASVKQKIEESGLQMLVVEGAEERHGAFKAADAAMAASGTVALELAIVGVPHIIAYKVPKLTEWVARHFIHIQFVNLSNILLGREIVPELLQNDCNPENIVFYMEQFLQYNGIYAKQNEGFAKVRKILGMGEQTPSDNAAKTIIDVIKKR